jgi:hypothetical protein
MFGGLEGVLKERAEHYASAVRRLALLACRLLSASVGLTEAQAPVP